MKIVLQRVKRAEASVEGAVVGRCEKGFLLLVGVERNDGEAEAELLAAKIAKLRVFSDENGKMNLSLDAVSGNVLAVSNFTLCADCRKGNRPDYFGAEEPGRAKELYEYFASRLEEHLMRPVARGVFGADMEISLINDGPVTIVLNSKELQSRKESL